MSTSDTSPEGIDDVESWLKARMGKCTASRVADAIRKTKTGWAASRGNYRMEIIAERLTGMRIEKFQSQAMMWGQQTEPDAVARYNAHSPNPVDTSSWFVPHPTVKDSGCSPDGLVGADGMVQIKCPETKTHIETLLSKEVDPDYIKQIQWEIACCGRQWSDFISYDPRLPQPLRMFVQRVYRDDGLIAQMESMVREFLSEIDSAIKSLGSFELPRFMGPEKAPEAVTGWSDNVPDSDFSSVSVPSVQELIERGLIKKGM